MPDKYYLTDENGEVIDIIDSPDKYVKLADGDRVIRKGVLQYLSQTVDLKYRFIKVNHLVYGKIAKKYPIINSLIKYTGYMDGILSYRNGVYVKIKDLPKICGVSESTAKRQLRGLLKDDVLHKTKDSSKKTCLVMNPYVAFIGKKIYMSLYEEFKLTEYRNECEEFSK